MDSTSKERAGFSTEQEDYLRGFAAGLAALGLLPGAAPNAGAAPPSGTPTVFGTPIDDLCKEERIKYEENALDIWEKLLRHAASDTMPEGGDIFRFKFHGLFNVAPAQHGLMVRVRIPGNILTSVQMRGMADITRNIGGGYAHITTRGNLQVREIKPRDIVNLQMKLTDIGLSSRGAGADNVRNVTATPTSGFDPEELRDVLPLARAMQFYLTNNRDLFGLPRKFNIAFDSGAPLSVVSDSNDIGFIATRVIANDEGVEADIHFRVQLAGITGHQRFAQDAGIVLRAEECVAFAAAVLRVFAEQGDRTDRSKARLLYLIERLGMPKFLDAVQAKLPFTLRHLGAEHCAPRAAVGKHRHLGVHPQRQPGLHYVGVPIPVGRLSPKQMEQFAALADAYGSGELRLTVWQSLILPNIPNAQLERVKREIARIGFDTGPDSIRSGIIACTGNTGCRFAATDTKTHALAIGDFLKDRVSLEQPLNIHLTGCPHSCAQHYIGDIGLLGAKINGEDGSIEGYHLYAGGGTDNEQGLAIEVAKNVPHAETGPTIKRLLDFYQSNRAPAESFIDFVRRSDIAQLQHIAAGPAS